MKNMCNPNPTVPVIINIITQAKIHHPCKQSVNAQILIIYTPYKNDVIT